MGNATVSIIIPVYNIKDYISSCINSILSQTYTDLQIIIVDDGSTDGTTEICRSLAKEDDRILFIRQENSGVSTARNAGLDNAKGKYVCFADGDDLLMNNAIESLVKDAYDGNFLIISRFQKIDENNAVICKSDKYIPKTMNSTEAIDNLLQIDSKIGYQGFLWNKLYVNETIQKNKLRFTDGIIYNEDRLFVFQYLMTGCNVIFDQAVTYQYRVRSGSAMDNVNKAFSKKQLTELTAFNLIEEELEKENAPLHKKANLAAFYCAYDLYKRVPKDDKYAKYNEFLIKQMKTRLTKVLFNTSRFVPLKDRCRIFYYWIKVRMRVDK